MEAYAAIEMNPSLVGLLEGWSLGAGLVRGHQSASGFRLISVPPVQACMQKKSVLPSTRCALRVWNSAPFFFLA